MSSSPIQSGKTSRSPSIGDVKEKVNETDPTTESEVSGQAPVQLQKSVTFQLYAYD